MNFLFVFLITHTQTHTPPLLMGGGGEKRCCLSQSSFVEEGGWVLWGGVEGIHSLFMKLGRNKSLFIWVFFFHFKTLILYIC